MSIDFEIPAEAKAIREKVRKWVHDECIPAEKRLLDGEDYKTVLNDLRTKARSQGLWLPFIPQEHGGMGLGPLANALVQMELGESHLGALSMNSQGPDDATILTLLAHGTDYQKEKFLKPLLNGEKRVCYSMTEKAAGADATGMQTRAVKDGNENYVLNGEKWFSSAASVADIAVVMAIPDPDAPRHQRYSTFIVDLPNPGCNIKRDIKTMAVEGPLSHILGGGHSEVEIKDLVVPAENLLGGEGQGFNMGQHRLAYGRLRELARSAAADGAPAASGSMPHRVPDSEQSIRVINPATGAQLAVLAVDGPAQVHAAVERARVAQKEWRAMTGAERGRLLQRAARLLREHQRIGRVAKTSQWMVVAICFEP